MIRIVGVQRSDQVEGEFVLLQNQGAMRQHLRGHLVLSELAYEGQAGSHLFNDDVHIGPSQFVMLKSGAGRSGWRQSRDGQLMYIAFAGQCQRIWGPECRAVHVLHVQHSYCERQREPLVV
ncbi:MAG: hypothetical protein JNM85_09125 [Chthonomonas sp.]|nr:hypothetical protein [Chthonomonas sp.]